MYQMVQHGDSPTIAAGPDPEDTREEATVRSGAPGGQGRHAMDEHGECVSVTVEEHEQLRRDFAVLKEQFDAVDGVLSAIGRAAGDPETVLNSVVESAGRLCRAQAAHLYLLEDGFFRLITSIGVSQEAIRF